MYYNLYLYIIFYLIIIENVKADFLPGVGIQAGYNFLAFGVVAGILVGTPCFFVIYFVLKNYEKKKVEENELKEIQKKIMNRKNNEEHNVTDTYGTSKLLKECIDKSSMNQIFNAGQSPSQSSPIEQNTAALDLERSDSSSSLSLSTLTGALSPIPQPQPRTTSCTLSKVSSSETISEVCRNNNNIEQSQCSSMSSSLGHHTVTSASADNHDMINRLMTPPSPVLSTFGKTEFNFSNVGSPTKNSLSINLPPASSALQIKRTIAMESPQPSPPPSSRPKNLRISQNAALLSLLSSNTIPKDHWHCIVYRVLEIAMSYWSPPKYDGQSSITALNQLELSLTGFSEQEQLKKNIETIDDQKYFSPIIFELYNKILPLHEFIRFRANKTEKDINSVFGVFTIILHSLFNSFNNWIDDSFISPEARRYNINQSKENIILKLGEHINDKSYLHKVTMDYLIVYIKNLLFTSIKDYNGESLYNIVDHYHGIADDIDKILFENEKSSLESEKLKPVNHPPNIQIVIDKLCLEDDNAEDSHQQSQTGQTSSSNSTNSNTPPAVGSLSPDEENLVNIISSVTNRFTQVDSYLENPSCNPEPKTMLTLDQQKTVVSSCYNHLQTSIDIFSVADYPSKFKVETVPVLRMLLSTLNTLEGYLEGGQSIVDLKPGEILEWTSTFIKIATSLNNLILKSSSLLSATQIVGYSSNQSTSLSSSIHSSGSFHPIRSSIGKIKPPSSPFGSPAIMSFLNANNNDQVFSPPKPTVGESSKNLSPLPPTRERCSQMIQLSQDSIMLTVMAAYALCLKENLNGVLPPSLKNVYKYFNDNLAVFLSAIRTNIFCTYILLNPIYDMQSFT